MGLGAVCHTLNPRYMHIAAIGVHMMQLLKQSFNLAVHQVLFHSPDSLHHKLHMLQHTVLGTRMTCDHTRCNTCEICMHSCKFPGQHA